MENYVIFRSSIITSAENPILEQEYKYEVEHEIFRLKNRQISGENQIYTIIKKTGNTPNTYVIFSI